MAIYEEVIECRTCKKTKSHTEFGKQKRWSEATNSVTEHLNSRQCKSCDNHDAKVRRQLEKQFPYPEKEVCACCGVDFTNKPKRKKRYLVLDHSHKTDTFRAYLCTKCNASVGGLGDELSTIQNRVSYLKPENILRLQNYYRKKDYTPNLKINNIKPKQLNMNHYDLVRFCIDQQDLDYATKVVGLIKNEYSVKVTESTSESSSELSTIEKRRIRKQKFMDSWKPFDSSKNLISSKKVFGLDQPMTIVNRKEETFLEYVNSGIFYKNPNGTQEFFVDVDNLDKVKVTV